MAAVKPTAPAQYSTVDPYEQYKNAYAAQQNAVNAANDAQILERQNREKQAQQTLAAGNRAANTAFTRMNSPQNKFQQQGNFSSGVSDYLKGASFGTYMKGLGANQQNYTEAMNNSNSLWQNWLAQKAGQEAQNASDYADKMAGQSNADRTFNYNQYRDQMADYQWQENFDWNKSRDERDYNRNVYESDRNYNYQVGRDKVLDARDERDYNRRVLESDRDYNRNILESDRAYNYQVGRDKVLDARDERNFNYQKSVDDRNYNYQVGRDKVTDAQWDKTYNRNVYESDRDYNEGVRQFNLNYDLSKKSASGGGYRSGGGGGSSPGGYDFDDTPSKSNSYNSGYIYYGATPVTGEYFTGSGKSTKSSSSKPTTTAFGYTGERLVKTGTKNNTRYGITSKGRVQKLSGGTTKAQAVAGGKKRRASNKK